MQGWRKGSAACLRLCTASRARTCTSSRARRASRELLPRVMVNQFLTSTREMHLLVQLVHTTRSGTAPSLGGMSRGASCAVRHW
jgi:hypothetical protein